MPSYRCKLCDEQAEDVALHLTERHGMNNERELFLVVCLIKGRKLAPVMQCPVPGCSVGKSSRLERHLDRIHRVDNHQRARFMEMAHRKAIVYELRALRETFPDPPMVSDIDMCHCVLINMTADEVSRAVTSPDGFRVISVKRHKTAAFFGRAKIALSPQEYTWLTDTIRHRSVASDYCFCAAKGNRCMQLLSQFRTAWRHVGLPGRPDFMMIRNSLVTHAHTRLPPRQRQYLARAMCHNTQTALQYYVTDQTTSLARSSRSLALRAVNALKRK
ncbi:uncharacterized protein LOC130549526 [Triplophysa rosa]|uniref:uncharacterized protein LOC130549526 n=1 Tax=Triplophysa rosa TaxID=992332 RepID=UPI002545E4FD|nr:uncharacterized protein LOC130549526 [Triplophysa rosa]